MKPTTPIFLLRKYGNIVLTKLVPLRKTRIDGMDFYYLRNGASPHHPEEFSKQGIEFHDQIRRLSGDIAIDVGANIGSYTVRLARSFRRVLAFEPNPSVAHILRLNIQSNKLENVTVEDTALSDKEGTFPVYVDSRYEGVSSLIPHRGGLKYDRVFLATVKTLDNYTMCEGKVDLIKIDAEGLELPILRGASLTITKYKPFLAVEVHCSKIEIPNRPCACETCAFLIERGYDVQVTQEVQSLTPVHWTWATPITKAG